MHTVKFVAAHLCSKPFLVSLLSLKGEAETNIQLKYLHLCQTLFTFLRATSASTDAALVELNALGYDALEQLNQLLSVPGFLAAITDLLQHDDVSIRQRALEMFNKKVEEERQDLTKGDVLLFLDMINEFTDIVSLLHVVARIFLGMLLLVIYIRISDAYICSNL